MGLADRNRPRQILGAIAGGVVGMAAMSIAFALLEVETRYEVGIFAGIARFVMLPGNLLFGFLVFVAFGAVVWPLLFVLFEDRIPGGPDPARRGLVFATLLWVLFALTGSGEVTGATLLIYGSLTLVGHLAYGFILGAVYGRIRPDFSVSEVRESREVP
ncbi:DUF6789 family protein [Halorussus sp. MSC15.2]|uniref:DUF6789 family protein n=1 Tax=Halorussus sp. MSC15.2 TaxID=2283638 RepID=UPI0013D5460E|nr:DUF6789 family protein [Halorussus sp. MSC15.2]NEU56993.1 hypothetical protein [Halorussus sp. MSC15.2]